MSSRCWKRRDPDKNYSSRGAPVVEFFYHQDIIDGCATYSEYCIKCSVRNEERRSKKMFNHIKEWLRNLTPGC